MHKRWLGKQVKWHQFYARVYHDDSRAAQDWRAIVSPEAPRHRVVPDVSPARDALETEYLSGVFEPLHFYGVPETQYDIGETGDLVGRQTWSIWRVVAKRGTFS